MQPCSSYSNWLNGFNCCPFACGNQAYKSVFYMDKERVKIIYSYNIVFVYLDYLNYNLND